MHSSKRINTVKECFCRRLQVFQHPQPQGLMRKEKGFPVVEGGNRDLCMFTNLLYTGPVQEAVPQHKEDKTQGIRGIGYQGTGEQDMGMAAGTALVTLYSYLVCDGKILFPLHQVTRIRRKRGQACFCMADRADTIRMGHAACFPLKPLPVRKRYLVQLAKNGKRPYH